MSGVGDMISGKSAKMARRAQEQQAAEIAAEKARVEKIRKGQEIAANTGGGGLLAYVDDTVKLKRTFG